MANSYFQFKQFRIDQEKSAMKVTTDACILGAYVPVPNGGYILDIGTGTGLLSLMVAQRSPAKIHAVELDINSYQEAKENILKSPWRDRITLYRNDIKEFSLPIKYDLIICNPPFFVNQLKSPSEKKSKAKHSDQLTIDALTAIASHLLKKNGKLAVLLPLIASKGLVASAEKNKLYAYQQLHLRDNPSRPFIRQINIFSPIKKNLHEESLTIKTGEGDYSEEFVQLLKDYYLFLNRSDQP